MFELEINNILTNALNSCPLLWQSILSTVLANGHSSYPLAPPRVLALGGALAVRVRSLPKAAHPRERRGATDLLA